MLRGIAAEAEAAGRAAVGMRGRLAAMVADTTVRSVMGGGGGGRWKDRDAFLRELSRANELAVAMNVADLWPSSWLARRLNGATRRAKSCSDAVYGLLDGVIKEHLERMDSGGGGDTQDLLDVLLRIHKDGQLPLDMDAIKAVIFDIFGAGSETSLTTLEWILAELIRHPKAMRKATAEVRHAFKDHGRVREHALGELQYLHLVVRETLRLRPPGPLLLPRQAREPCRVLGYDAPEGATVMVNVWALARDERYWPGGAEEFRPERFESGGEAHGVEFRGADFELLPFGAGRRMCPGVAFGLASIELPLASLLFHFDWEVPGLSDPADLDMTEAYGVNLRRKEDLLLRPVLRVPVPAAV